MPRPAVIVTLCLQLLRAHQVEHTVLANLPARVAQIGRYLAIDVDRAVLQRGLLHQAEQTTGILRTLRGWLCSPGLVPATLHLYDPAPHSDRVLVFVGMNEGVPDRDLLTKCVVF